MKHTFALACRSDVSTQNAAARVTQDGHIESVRSSPIEEMTGSHEGCEPHDKKGGTLQVVNQTPNQRIWTTVCNAFARNAVETWRHPPRQLGPHTFEPWFWSVLPLHSVQKLATQVCMSLGGHKCEPAWTPHIDMLQDADPSCSLVLGLSGTGTRTHGRRVLCGYTVSYLPSAQRAFNLFMSTLITTHARHLIHMYPAKRTHLVTRSGTCTINLRNTANDPIDDIVYVSPSRIGVLLGADGAHITAICNLLNVRVRLLLWWRSPYLPAVVSVNRTLSVREHSYLCQIIDNINM